MNKIKTLFICSLCALGISTLFGCSNYEGEITDISSFTPIFRGIEMSSIEDFYSTQNVKKEVINRNTKLGDLIGINRSKDKSMLYAMPSEKFYVIVYIENPKGFEIQSFTLNGEKYASYMFKEGSTMEKVVLETTAENVPGIYTYVVDAVKYIDGTTIKDVDMSKKNKTVQMAVSHMELPEAENESPEVDAFSSKINVNLKDNSNLITSKKAKFYLAEDGKVIQEKEINLGKSLLNLDNLKLNTEYEYGVAAEYDSLDGYGKNLRWLLLDSFKTEDGLRISEITPGKDNVEFVIDKKEGISVEKINIIDENTNLVSRTIIGYGSRIDGLLSNHKYKLEVVYSYEYDGEIIDSTYTSEEFCTLTKNDALIQFESTEAFSDRIKYVLKIVDVDKVIVGYSVALYQNGVQLNVFENRLTETFTNLDSDSSYELYVRYSCNYGDGQEDKKFHINKIVYTSNKKTHQEPNMPPEPILTTLSATPNSLEYKLIFTDRYGKLKDYSVSLFYGETFIKTYENQEIGIFDDLEADVLYKAVVDFSYYDNHNLVQTSQRKFDMYTSIENITIKSINPLNQYIFNGSIGKIEFELAYDERLIEVNSMIINNQEYSNIIITGFNKFELTFNPFKEGDKYEIGEEIEFTVTSFSFLDKAERKIYKDITPYVFKMQYLPSLRIDEISACDFEIVNGEYVFSNEGDYIVDQGKDTCGIKYTFNDLSFNGANIEEIEIDGVKPLKIDYENNCAYFEFSEEIHGGMSYFININEVKIFFDNGAAFLRRNNISGYKDFYFVALEDSKEIEISSAEDFLNIRNSENEYRGFYKFVFTNDLDFSKYDCFMYGDGGFRGYFEGNGHKLKNISYYLNKNTDSYMTETSFYEFSLFGRYFQGLIKNLTIENVFIVGTIETDYSLICAGFAHHCYMCGFVNCAFEGDFYNTLKYSDGVDVSYKDVITLNTGYHIQNFYVKDCKGFDIYSEEVTQYIIYDNGEQVYDFCWVFFGT